MGEFRGSAMKAEELASIPLWRKIIWWVWCAITRPIRPLAFMALLCASALFGWHGANQYYLETGWTPQTATLEGRIEKAFQVALPESGGVPVWQEELDVALDPVQVGRPDVLLARSLARSLDRIAGNTELGLYVMSKRQPISDLEPSLRARPAWRQQQILDQAISSRLLDADIRQLDPAGMIFADATIRERFTRASRLFNRSIEGAEGWFIDPEGRTLGLHTLPGWQNRLDHMVWLGRDIDTLVNQSCGLIFLGLGEHINGCFDESVAPVSEPDLVLWQWTLLAYGLDSGQMDAPDGAGAGARLLAALRVAGLMKPGLELPPDRDVIDRALVTGAPLLESAGAALNQPNRFTAQGAELANQSFEGRHSQEIIALASDAAALRRNVGAINALKLLSVAQTQSDVRRLVEISDQIGDQTVALLHLHRANPTAVFEMTHPYPPVRGEALRFFYLCAGFLALAFFMLLISFSWAWWEAGKIRKSFVKRIARGAESLILGRKL